MFLDLIIWIDRKSQKLKYKPYTKNENLFTCMSPNSAHSPNTLKEMIRSMMGRAWRHCSDKNDYTIEISLLCQRLIDAGHNPENLTIIFRESASKLQKQLKLEKSSSTKIKTGEPPTTLHYINKLR